MGDRKFHHTYDQELLEIITTGQAHEWKKSILGRVVERLAYELDMETKGFGSATHARSELGRGITPDECFYIANEPLVRYRFDIDLATDPPPDLAIEIDITGTSIPRMPVYEALGVPELWRYGDGNMLFYSLSDAGKYRAIDHSVAFPFLTPAKLCEFLDMRESKSDLQIIKALVAWVPEQKD